MLVEIVGIALGAIVLFIVLFAIVKACEDPPGYASRPIHYQQPRSVDEENDVDASCRIDVESENTTEVFYHYTTPKAADKILRTGLLKKSMGAGGRDAVYGTGVYLTKMAPAAGKLKIAMNNWDGMSRHAERLVDQCRLDAVIRLQLDQLEVMKVDNRLGRDIYLYPDDLRITDDMNATKIGYTLHDEFDTVD